MATRNMRQTAETVTGKINTNYDLTAIELNELRNMILKDGDKGVFNALSMAFKYGYVLGHRATEKNVYSETRRRGLNNGL